MPPNNSSNFGLNFHASVDAIFKNWTALQLAVSQGAGGTQSNAIADWMVDAVVQWFKENENLAPYEVTEFLEQIINQEFNLIVDDGSTDEIGTTVCEFFQLCSSSKSNDEIMNKIRSLPKCDLSKCTIDGQTNEEETITINQNKLEEQMRNLDPIMEVDHDSASASDPSNNSNCANEPKTEPDSDGWVVVERKKK